MSRRARLGWASAAVAAVVAGLIALTAYLTAPTELKLAVETSSDDIAMFTAFNGILKRERASVRIVVEPVSSPEAALVALDDDRAQLAILRADRGIPVEGRAVAKLRENVLALIVPGDAQLGTPASLGGRRIGLVGRDADARHLAVVLEQYGLPVGSWEAVPVEGQRLAAALTSGEIHAAAVVAPATGQILADAVRSLSQHPKGAVFIAIELAEAIVQRHPSYETADIVAGTFRGSPPQPPENVGTIGFAHYLIAPRRLSEQAVAEVTRRLFEARSELAQAFPSAALLEAPGTEKDAVLPAHRGTLAYLNDGEKTFFDRYGDWVYILAMVLPVVVTLAAGVANYLGGAQLRQRATTRRLARLLRRSGTAPDAAELAKIEAEADAIVTRAMARVEAGTLPESAPTTLAIKLDLIRRAVAERRAMLRKASISSERRSRARPAKSAARN